MPRLECDRLAARPARIDECPGVPNNARDAMDRFAPHLEPPIPQAVACGGLALFRGRSNCKSQRI